MKNSINYFLSKSKKGKLPGFRKNEIFNCVYFFN